MKSNLLRSPILVAALAVAGGLALIGRDALTAPALKKAPGAATPKQAASRPAAAPAPAAPRAQPTPSFNTVPKNLVTISLLLRNQIENRRPVPTKWDGTATVSQGGRLAGFALSGRGPTARVTENGWMLTTTRVPPRRAGERKVNPENMPVEEGRVYLMLADATPNTRVDVETEQGAFSFVLSEVPFGAVKTALERLVSISRAPNTARIVSAPTEEDWPAAAYGKDGKLYVAYQAFTHGEGFATRPQFEEEPKDLSFLAKPTGGDQIFLIRLDGEKWSKPMEVTPPKQDVYRLAAAADGSGRIWVVWSGNEGENWDVYARWFDGSAWSPKLRLSDDPGPDVLPAAATDAEGRVWIAWQGFRGDNSNIFAVRQEGSGVGKPIVIAEDKANEWAPALAASPAGAVGFAWDTYANGNYDVYARVWSKGQLGKAMPIAVSAQGEARPSAAYDRGGRLWIAYEVSPEKWGKDYGFYEKSGARLYEARQVAVRVVADGRLMEPAEQPFASAAPPAASPAASPPAPPAAPGKDPSRSPTSKYADPRVACDGAGRVWLSARHGFTLLRSSAGTIWGDSLAWYEGLKWSDAIPCPETDGTLDSPPSLVAQPGGGVALVSATDGRLAAASRPGGSRPGPPPEKRASAPDLMERPVWADPVNNEIAMAVLADDSLKTPAPPELKPVAEASPPAMPEEAKKEAQAIAKMREQRATVGGKTLRLARGEFHRHTEMSGDGGGDGMLTDMWRYAHDMADMDWIGNGDHDNGSNREYPWWLIQKTTSMFRLPGVFEPMYTYERSVIYPDGHRNAVFPKRGIRPLPRLRDGFGEAMDDLEAEAPRPHSPDTLMLYRYLKELGGLCASHTSGTPRMGTDWRDNDPEVEPVVEIYQGDRDSYEMPGAPRAVSAEKAAAGFQPFGFVSLALQKGYRLGFQSSSDHVSVHMSYCNVWAEDLSRQAIYEAMKKRHVYGATDNIVAEFRCADHFMGDEFSLSGKPTFHIRILGAEPIAKVDIVKDGKYVCSQQPNKSEVEFDWTDADVELGKTSYYYVRGEQSDGELVWISPMWITFKP